MNILIHFSLWIVNMGSMKILLLFCVSVVVIWTVSGEHSSRVKRATYGLLGKAKRRAEIFHRAKRWKALMEELKNKKKQEPMMFRRLAEIDGSNYEARQKALGSNSQLWYIEGLESPWDKIMGVFAKFKKFVTQLYVGNKRDGINKEGILNKNTIKVKPDKPKPKVAEGDCPFFKVDCSDIWYKKYRTIEGSCNNLKSGQEHWGAANTPQNRLIRPDYANRINKPRVAKSGKDLPSARLVTLKVFNKTERKSEHLSLMMVSFGQFLDHDLTHTPGATAAVDPKTNENIGIDCGKDGCGVEGLAGEECFPIITPPGDPIYGPKKTCVAFVRSAPSLDVKCSFKDSQRQVLNAITSFVDMSSVYGSHIDETKHLRDFSSTDRARMLVSKHPVDSSFKDLLPYHDDKTSGCAGLNKTIRCFRAGDIRQNEQMGLTSFHTVLVRLHNEIEAKLYKILKHKGKKLGREHLFQEVRKIMGGLWQKIVYDEYLPLVLGHKIMHDYGLKIKKFGYFKGYDENENGQILASFSTAAFRFGHSMISSNMTFADHSFNKIKELKFNEIVFNPSAIYRCPFASKHKISGIDAIMNGIMTASAEKTDHHFTQQISGHLFTGKPPFGQGLDLTALNIQRGRDHGLPGYVHWRKQCGLSVPKTFHDLVNIPGVKNIKDKLKLLYESVEDIDLFVAGISETPVKGGAVGPTFACLIGEQFRRLKIGDRFYFENQHTFGFSESQLVEIRKFTLARLLCDTMDKVETIQPFVLLKANRKFNGKSNARVKCDQIPQINYNVFV